MTIKASMKNLFVRSVHLGTRHAGDASRDRRNIDLVLQAELSRPDVLSIVHYPAVYAEFLRACIEPVHHTVKEVKSSSLSAGSKANRFSQLLVVLQEGTLPPLEISTVREIGLLADRNCGLSDPYEPCPNGLSCAVDVGLHFSLSSSFGEKGRILYNIVRFMRSQRCLELGTAYGMSAFFILAALEKYVQPGCLATIEGGEPQFSLASAALKNRFPQKVACHFGDVNKQLRQVFESLGQADFVFHDAGHSRDIYIRDFDQLSQALAPCAVVLFDDIRWTPSDVAEDPHTYEGWQQVIAHPRVRHAVEIDDTLGLLFFE